jgi:HK97 family phage prohead protease
METKALPTEFKVSSDGWMVEGYASTFGNVDYVGDMVMPGAYKRTLNNSFKRIKLMRDHEHPIGAPIEAYEDSQGLYTKSRISQTTLGADTRTLLLDGVLDRMSIGYEPVQKEHGKHEGKDVRFLKEIKLYEWSIVTFPANDAAAVTGIKALEDLDRAFHEFKAGKLPVADLVALVTKAAVTDPAPLDAPPAVATVEPALDSDTSDSTAVIADLKALIGDIRTSIRRAA